MTLSPVFTVQFCVGLIVVQCTAGRVGSVPPHRPGRVLRQNRSGWFGCRQLSGGPASLWVPGTLRSRGHAILRRCPPRMAFGRSQSKREACTCSRWLSLRPERQASLRNLRRLTILGCDVKAEPPATALPAVIPCFRWQDRDSRSLGPDKAWMLNNVYALESCLDAPDNPEKAEPARPLSAKNPLRSYFEITCNMSASSFHPNRRTVGSRKAIPAYLRRASWGPIVMA